jgi:riboflavin kinase/FMN adenylyltransferase
MKLITDLEQIETPLKNPVVTIGNFDGVHIGHQSLFHEVIERADEIEGTSVAITFEPHPIKVLTNNGSPPLITMFEQKLELIESTGIDVLVCIPFTRETAGITAEDFVKKILVDRLGMRVIIVGQDYTFGRNRSGNVALLQELSQKYDYEVVVADWIENAVMRRGRISSTRIRDLVMAGRVAESRKLLGRYYQIRGVVARGQDRGGKLLGFPTANINLQDELCPKTGVYAVTVECLSRKYKGVANIGYSPTFDDHQFTVEVHILDFNEDVYGRKIRVNFVQRIREETKFRSVDELAEQIKKDVEEARRILPP